MRCWVVRRMLSLHGGKNDLPLFESNIEKHLQKCSECAKEHESYCAQFRKLNLVNSSSLKEDSFENYWHDLQTKLETQRIKPLPADIVAPSWLPAARLAAVCVLCFTVGVIFTRRDWGQEPSLTGPITNTIGITKENPKLKNVFTPEVKKQDDFQMPVYLSRDIPFSTDSTINYKLQKVQPCVLQETDF